MNDLSIMLLKEVVDALAPYGDLPCTPSLATDRDGKALTLTLTVPWRDGQAAELFFHLRYAVDVAQMRGFATRYDIPAEQLEAFLPKQPEQETGE